MIQHLVTLIYTFGKNSDQSFVIRGNRLRKGRILFLIFYPLRLFFALIFWKTELGLVLFGSVSYHD